MEVIPSGGWFVYIKNKSRPKTDPCSTPEFVFVQSEPWPSKATHCSLLLR